MAGSIFFRILNTAISKKSNNTKLSDLSFFISLFVLLMLLEVGRNFTTYGMSAPGEFRFRYLILIIPIIDLSKYV